MPMPSRADMDRPARAAAFTLGVLLIALGTLLFVVTAPAAAKTYAIAWTQADAPGGKADAPFAGNGQKASVTVTVRDGLFSNVTVTMPSCSDAPGAAGQPAAVSYELFKDNASIAKGNAPCAQDADVKTVALHRHADVGKAPGDSAGAAESAAYAGDGSYHNATHTFRLDFSYARPGSPLPPLPVGGPTFAGRMGVAVQEWRATASIPQEAGK